MSRFDYDVSRVLSQADYPFYALVMAAYRQADTTNAAKLRAAWPDVVDELDARYNAPGGVIPSDGAPPHPAGYAPQAVDEPEPCPTCRGAGGWQQHDGAIEECPRSCMTGADQ